MSGAVYGSPRHTRALSDLSCLIGWPQPRGRRTIVATTPPVNPRRRSLFPVLTFMSRVKISKIIVTFPIIKWLIVSGIRRISGIDIYFLMKNYTSSIIIIIVKSNCGIFPNNIGTNIVKQFTKYIYLEIWRCLKIQTSVRAIFRAIGGKWTKNWPKADSFQSKMFDIK